MNARRIRALRRRSGWTQAELAERLGTDHVTVSRWERGISQPRSSARARLRHLEAPVPLPVSELVAIVGPVESERLLRRSLLLARRPGRPRFAANPTRRLRQVEHARREQLALREAIRLGR